MTPSQPQIRHNTGSALELNLTYFLPKLSQPLRWPFFVATLGDVYFIFERALDV